MYTKEELEDMLHEINWSGTPGFNIHAQRKLTEMCLMLLEELEEKKREE